jgi:hypothetical protein
MRKLALVQFFSWFALFCMWIYFAPGVAKGIYRGVPLGVVDAEADRRLEAPAAAPTLDAAAAAAGAYEALKRQMAEKATAAGEVARGGALDAVLTMLGLKTPPPDPAARVTTVELTPILGRALARGSGGPAGEGEKANPMVRTIASLLLENGLAPGVVPHVESLQAASGALVERFASARRYQEGVAWGGVCFATYNLVAFGFAFLLLALVKRSSARAIHLVCLALGGCGLLSVLVIHQPGLLLLSMVGVGIAWASILAMPYAMLSNALPPARMGFYMGVFNFFIVLPQILASVGLGTVMEHLLHNDATKALLLGGSSMLVAALLTRRLKEAETE